MVSLNGTRAFIEKEKPFFWMAVFVVMLYSWLTVLNSVSPGSSAKVKGDEGPAVIDPEAERIAIERKIAEQPIYYFIFVGIVVFFAGAGLIGLVIDTLFLGLWRLRPLAGSGDVPVIPWGIWDVWKVIIMFFFAQSILTLTHGLLRGLGLFANIAENAATIAYATLLDIVVLAAILYIALGHYRSRPESLGLTGRDMPRNILYGVAGYIGLIPVMLAVLFAVFSLSHLFDIPLKPQDIVEIFKKEKEMGFLLYMAIFAGLLGPFVEELFFRWFLYGALRKVIGAGWGIALSALCFASLHANLASFFPILALGILLAYIYERTGSLVPSITVHILHNGFMLILVFLTKGLYG